MCHVEKVKLAYFESELHLAPPKERRVWLEKGGGEEDGE